jgi:hypothetical protein
MEYNGMLIVWFICVLIFVIFTFLFCSVSGLCVKDLEWGKMKEKFNWDNVANFGKNEQTQRKKKINSE